MDRVFFELKRGHIETEKWGRCVLARFGLTPARFDVLFALDGAFEMTQTALRRMLGVARATISEMLALLERLELVVRTRADRDRRTWLVELTSKGAAVFRRAAEATMHNGYVPLVVDSALCANHVERDSFVERHLFAHRVWHLLATFGTPPSALYEQDLDLIEGAIADIDDPLGEFEPVGSGT